MLQGRTSEIILRDPDQLQYIVHAAEEASQLPGSDKEQLEQLKKIIEKKKTASGTKAQLKPAFKDGECEKVAVVVKWGGEFTHAARYQARDIAENMRKGELGTKATLARELNLSPRLLDPQQVLVRSHQGIHELRVRSLISGYSETSADPASHRRRVVATAEIFSTWVLF